MNPIATYTSLIDLGMPNILRGNDNSQNDTALPYLNPLSRGGSTSGGTAGVQERTEGIAIGYVSLLNRSGGAAVVGLGGRLPNYMWQAGQWVDATTTYTDDTTDAQSAAGTDFPLETLTINDGYIIASRVPFNAISIDVGTASVDAVSIARAARYSNSAGTGWNALTTLFFSGSATNLATGEAVIAWETPTDWGVHVSGLGTNTPVGRYLINVRTTDAANTTAAVADNLSIYRLYFLESIANNATKEINFAPAEAWLPNVDALVAFFSVANASNKLTALVRPRS